jgi:nitrogen regulatory protein PII
MDLITAVVRSSLAEGVLEAARKAGAPGITYFPALGTGVKESMGFVGSLIEHEKKALWIVVSKKDTQKVLEAIVDAANLSLPGEGFAYVQPVSFAVGFVPSAD